MPYLSQTTKRTILILIFASVALLTMVAIAAVLINIKIIETGERYTDELVDGAPTAQVAIVLGAKVYRGGSLSWVLADRVDTAVELYRSKKVKKLLLTGDHGQTNYDEVNAMRRYALSLGVPEQDVFMDHAGFSTYESMYRARDVFEVKRAIVVTQQFHLARSIYTARSMGIDATGVAADKHIYAQEAMMDAREALARVKAFIQLHVTHNKPKFLGPKIPITGDGRVTIDSASQPDLLQ